MPDPLPLPWTGMKNFLCFGCAPDHPFGLRLRFEPDGAGLRSAFVPTRAHESYPGVVHGGVSAAVLDEVMGNVLALRAGRLCFTVGMRLQFVQPLRPGEAYVVHAEAAEGASADPEGIARVHGEIRTADGGTAVAATGTYRWISVREAVAVLDLTEDQLAPFRHYFRDA